MVLKKLLRACSKQKFIVFTSLIFTAGILFTVNQNNTSEVFLNKNSLFKLTEGEQTFSPDSSITPCSPLFAMWYRESIERAKMDGYNNDIKRRSNLMNENSFDPK